MIHTGQHFDINLSDVFFRDFSLRTPDVRLNIGKSGRNHVEQLSILNVDLTTKLQELGIDKKKDIILFLGDSNSVASSLVLKKEGYTIGHVESGSRSSDKRMSEEINRIVCDQCSDILFPYHENYAEQLRSENIWANIHVVGNTILEVARKVQIEQKIYRENATKDFILVDIHRPENFNYPKRMASILEYIAIMGYVYQVPVLMLEFKRTLEAMQAVNLSVPLNVELIPLMGYVEYLKKQNNSLFVISDSGTAQEECPIFDVPIVCPREFTERPESMESGCSFLLKDSENKNSMKHSVKYIDSALSGDYVYSESRVSQTKKSLDWLGDGKTSERIVNILENYK
jgi:UDP-N-acetylglucosamine 2-epimerase